MEIKGCMLIIINQIWILKIYDIYKTENYKKNNMKYLLTIPKILLKT